MKKLNHESLKHKGKKSLSVKDEKEYRSGDAASKWLEKNDKQQGRRGKVIS